MDRLGSLWSLYRLVVLVELKYLEQSVVVHAEEWVVQQLECLDDQVLLAVLQVQQVVDSLDDADPLVVASCVVDASFAACSVD